MTTEIARLPLPETLEPKNAKRSLFQNVKGHFYTLYNSNDKTFQEFLKAVGNKDAVTRNRNFDRHQAVIMIKKLAKETQDLITANATDGDVYEQVVKVMRLHPELGLKMRRIEYQRFSQAAHQLAAE